MEWTGLIVFLGADDLEETHKFYNEQLGLSLYKDQGVCRIYSLPGGGMLGFCQHMANVAEDTSPYITLLTEDVDTCHQKLLADGVAVLSSPKVNPKYNIYHFFVRDPNGYKVEIQKFLD